MGDIETLALEVLGSSFLVRSEGHLARAIADLWAPFAVENPGTEAETYSVAAHENGYRLTFPSGEASNSDDLWILLDSLRAQLSIRPLLRTNGLVGLHASVLSRGSEGLLLVGEPFAGKTTLMLELLRDGGWNYVSDDLAVFDAEGRLLPFPKPLSVRSPERWANLNAGWPAGEHMPRPQIVGLLPGTLLFGGPLGDLVPHRVVFPRWDPDATPTQERVSPGMATARCIQNCQNQENTGALAPRVFGSLCTTVPVWSIEYPSSHEARNLLEKVLAPAGK